MRPLIVKLSVGLALSLTWAGLAIGQQLSRNTEDQSEPAAAGVKLSKEELEEKILKVAREQGELAADLQELIEDQTVEDVIALLELVEDAMDDATERLVRTDTGGEAIAAQTDVIEKIFQAAKKKAENRKQQNQQQQEKEESGDEQGEEGQDGETGEGQSGEGQPGEGQPGEGQPGEGQPGEGQPGEGQPGEGQPGEGQPGEGQPGEGQPGEGQPGEGQPGEGQPGEGESAQGRPSPNDERIDQMLEMMEKMMGDDDQGEQEDQSIGEEEGKGGGQPGEGSSGDSDLKGQDFGGDNQGNDESRKVPKDSGVTTDSLPREFREAVEAYNRGLRERQRRSR